MGRGIRRRPKLLGEKLLRIRLAHGLTQEELLDYLELGDVLSRAKISEYERGEREPDLMTLLAYSRSVGITLEILADDDLELPKDDELRAKVAQITKASKKKLTRK